MGGDERRRTGRARPLFTAAEVASHTGGRPVPGPGGSGTLNSVITGVEADSRYIRPGDLFCALPGERVDGHDFVGQAFRAGALAALVSRVPIPAPPEVGLLIVVPDVLAALAELARRHLARFPVRVIGVTGSVGKTTTKDLITAALTTSFSVIANRGNLNTDIGLPLTIFEVGPEHELACLEMGMRGPGEIARLAALARPETGVLTNIGPVHIELLGSIEAIARAKEELLWELPGNGSAVLNADDPLVARAAEAHRSRLARVLTYGLDQPADVTASSFANRGPAGAAFNVVLSGVARDLARGPDLTGFSIPLAGRHSVSNALAAVACGLLYGAPPEAMRSGLAAARLSPMRQETVTAAGVRVINDAYNAGPASMAAAIELLAHHERRGRAIAFLGDMLELGDLSEAAHREIGRVVAGSGIDYLFAVGSRSAATIDEALKAGFPPARAGHFTETSAAVEAVLEAARPGDVVLVKASRGIRLEDAVSSIIAGLKARERSDAGPGDGERRERGEEA